MATTRPGEGTILQIKVSSTFTSLGLMEEIDGPEVTAAAVKKTTLGDTLHKYRKSRQVDPGKVSFKLQFDPDDATQQLIYDHMTSGSQIDDDFKIVFADDQVVPAHCTFSGFFTKFKLAGMKSEENLMAECEVQVNTLPVFVDGAAS